MLQVQRWFLPTTHTGTLRSSEPRCARLFLSAALIRLGGNMLESASQPGPESTHDFTWSESRSPVFVLCMARSGSTLLRFILDAHPEVACPPETNLPALCAQLAVVWSLIEGAPLSMTRGDTPPVVPPAAVAGIRRTLDNMLGPYLARRGKVVLCDKSLGTAQYASLLADIYPGARFISLYRHPMDVIASGMEACPWGLNGYGFDPYISGSPGNAVCALARYWLENATMIARVEEQYPDRCHRVRYEDLVEAPEQVADGMFRFAGVTPEPGVMRRCFTAERERLGPGDHKIWHTSQVTAASVGRSQNIPVGLIPPAVLEETNELLSQLGYLPVDETWGTAAAPSAPHIAQDHNQVPALAAAGPAGSGGPVETPRILAERLRDGLDHADAQFTSRWAPCSLERFTLVSRQHQDAHAAQWLVDMAARTVTFGTLTTPSAADTGSADGADGANDGATADGDPDWSIIGTPETWTAVLHGQVNLSVAVRRCDLRYCDFDEPDHPATLVADVRIDMMAALLGLTTWDQSETQTVPARAPGLTRSCENSRTRPPWPAYDPNPALAAGS